MTQEQLNTIQEQTKKITNPKLLEVMRTLKKCAEEKTNPEPQYQVDYIDNLMEARLLAPVTVTDMSGENENQMKVQFSHLTNPQNEKYFMVFSVKGVITKPFIAHFGCDSIAERSLYVTAITQILLISLMFFCIVSISVNTIKYFSF